MPKLTKAKVIEATAAQAAWASGGTGEAALCITRFCEYFGVGFAHTDEETAGRRLSSLYINGVRLNNGRGERAFDAIHDAPIDGMAGAIRERIPVSYKAGDARDVSTDIPLMQSILDSGMPYWVYLLDGDAKAVDYTDGIRVDVEPAKHITMRRINLTQVLADFLSDWNICEETEGKVAFVRKYKITAGGKEYIYPRLRVNWGKVPPEYWLDAEPVDFDPAAPLPCPWW
jgi:hypothetical protein